MRGRGLFRGLRHQRRTGEVLTMIFEDNDLTTGWSGVNMTIGAAPENDPEQGVLAAQALETVTDNAHYVHANIAMVQGVTYRIRIVLKGVGRTIHTVLVAETPTKYWYAIIGADVPTLSFGMSNPAVVDLGGGWYAHSIDFTLSATSGSKNLRIGAALEPLDTTYPGDITKGLYIGSVKIYEVAA